MRTLNHGHHFWIRINLFEGQNIDKCIIMCAALGHLMNGQYVVGFRTQKMMNSIPLFNFDAEKKAEANSHYFAGLVFRLGLAGE